MRSLDKKQPAEDNLSLEPWVLGGRVDLLDGGRGHVCMHFTQFYRCVFCLLVCRGLFVSFYYRLILRPYTSHYSHTHRTLTSVSDQNILRLSLGIRSVSARLSESVCLSRSVKLTYSLYASSMHAHERAN